MDAPDTRAPENPEEAVNPPDFEEDAVPPRYIAEARPGDLTLDLGSYEGPLDVLLILARTQKVDLRQISILALAEQYLAFIARITATRLEVAADYLVMAAWLAFLKSRLLLPEAEDEEGPSGEEMAARLAFRLRRLEAMREAAARIMSRARLGRDVFARGEPEGVAVIRKTTFVMEVYDLLKAYSDQRVRQDASILFIRTPRVFSVEESLDRLRRLIGEVPEWAHLMDFLPENIGPATEGIDLKSAIASTFAASLEIAKQGAVQLRQAETFGPIFIRGRTTEEGDQNES